MGLGHTIFGNQMGLGEMGIKWNYRFLKDWNNPMRRMNCMRRCRIPENNIIS